MSVTEGDAGTRAATFTVSSSNPSDRTIDVGATTADGSAVAPGDYAARNAKIVIPPGDTERTFTVEVAGDLIDELDERYFVGLSDAHNAAIADGEGVGTIRDDDDARLSVDDVSVVEGDSGSVNATFTVSSSNPSDRTMTVHAATADGSARAPADYEAPSEWI